MKKFYDHLRSRIEGSEPVLRFERQEDNESQQEVVNDEDDHPEINLKMIKDICADITQETKFNAQEITKIKNRMDKLFEMVENITNNEGKIKQRSNKIKRK